MDKAYWNKIGSGYNSEIFDAYKEDRTGKLKKYLNKYSNKDHIAVDVGCGTGKALTYLSPAFKKVLGVDISSELLQQARSLGYANVEFKRADLSKPVKLPPADFAFCCNVAILPDMQKNLGIINNTYRALKRNGAAIFVLPSLESSLLAGWQIIDQYKKDGVSYDGIPKDELAYFDGGKKDLLQGLVKISGVKTKHYTAPEIQIIFRREKFAIKKIEKLEYNWTTEFARPPKSLRDPYPWDWLVECAKS